MNAAELLAALRRAVAEHVPECDCPRLQVEGHDWPRIRCCGCQRTVWRARTPH